ncbi:MAG TPA: hypothetical protein PKK39_04805 [Tepidiformaceae bacterium]|nr:hypothetical protein [Tepidiformaceae bacterium]
MNQDERRAEIDRLMEEDRLEEASELADQLKQIDADEFTRQLNAAPLDDEPVSPALAARLAAADEAIERALASLR